MAVTFEQTYLWKRSLANRDLQDLKADRVAKARLRNSFLAFRERAAFMVGEIHRDLPEYALPDVSHLDSVWEITDLIIGDNYVVTPTEAYILGAAILFHDAGMSLAALPGGFEALRKNKIWADIVNRQYRKIFNRLPTPEELKDPAPEIKQAATALLLRNLQAEKADELVLIEWQAESESAPCYLIEDTQIRQSFGKVIGQVASSRCLSVAQLETKFSRTIPAPHWCPESWTIDPLKVACILRLAVAGHAEARWAGKSLNAPGISPLPPENHGENENKLNKPYRHDDALIYISQHNFSLPESESWWLSLETLRQVDEELRQVDALFAERGLQRLAIRRVAGIDQPGRFASYVPTDEELTDTGCIEITDRLHRIRSLVCKELYGDDKRMPLRELIQNAADAIRARRERETRPDAWGTIRVCFGQDEQGSWIEFQDTGIGMTRQALHQYMFDFGRSYWGSDLMIEENPGLFTSGTKLAGQYGIGFFSIFMLGSALKISTRRYDCAPRETIVLEYYPHIRSKPIFRPAEKHEQIREGGTRVRVWLDKTSEEYFDRRKAQNLSIQRLFEDICPSIDVKIEIRTGNDNPVHLISCQGWIDADSKQFFRNIRPSDDRELSEEEQAVFEDLLTRAGRNLRLIRGEKNKVIGRACIGGFNLHSNDGSLPLRGAITADGMYSCSLLGIAGILTGSAVNHARDLAIPEVSSEAIAQWATEQAGLVPLLYEDPEGQMRCAEVIRFLGGSTEKLPIGYFREKWVSYADLMYNKNLPDEIYLVSDLSTRSFRRIKDFKFQTNVIAVDYAKITTLIQSRHRFNPAEIWPKTDKYKSLGEYETVFRGLRGAVIEAIMKAWGLYPINLPLEYIKDITEKQQELVIGFIGEIPVSEDVYVIKKPI